LSFSNNGHDVRKLTLYPETLQPTEGSWAPASGQKRPICTEKLQMPRKTAASMDRRVARTRKTLQHALLTLMLRKGYDAVTVEDICREADIGRSTFYAHFTGKDALKRSGLDTHLRAALMARQDASPRQTFAFALPFFEHAKAHLDLYRALVAKGGVSTTLVMMRQIVAELLRKELGRTRAGDAPREAAVQFLVGAFMSLLIWWLDGGARLSPQQLDAMFRQLASEGAL
jgi:AcrR family transcriptional regulator